MVGQMILQEDVLCTIVVAFAKFVILQICGFLGGDIYYQTIIHENTFFIIY
jgi:hypothetical protein